MNNNMNPFTPPSYSSDPILQQYYLTVQQSLLNKSLEGDTSTTPTSTSPTSTSTSTSTCIKKNRPVKMTSSFGSSSSAIPGAIGTYGFANVTPIPSSASSVTSSSGTASGSGSESDVSSLAAAAAANARAQAAAMAVAAQVGAPVSATAAMFGGNPQALAAMAMAQNGGSGIGAAPANMNIYSAQAQAQAQAAGYGAQAMIAAPHHPIPEFLYQLTKMLTDDNSAYIEWKEGRIFVYDPPALADNVLHRYFRHSKYASFQRQLNYFGFKKLAGKGKMSPCSYINENATDDIRSLLFIKRKTNGPKAPQAKKNKNGAVGTENGKPSAGGRKRKAATSKNEQARVIPSGQPASNFVAQCASHPYEMALAQQQALLAAQQQQLSSSTGSSTYNPGVNASASTDTSETFHFPTDQALQQLQQQQLQQQMLQEQKHFEEQQLQHQRQQQLDFLQAQQSQQNQQNQQQQATAGNGETSASMPCPATMAMNAASAVNALAGGNGECPTTGGGNSLFGSSANLASLLKTDTAAADAENGAAQVGSNLAPLSAAPSSAFLSSLPSSNTLFPDSISSLSLNRLLTGATPAPGGLAGGMPSMLGLNGFLSRESSLLNLAMGLPANRSSQALQAMGASAPTASESKALPEGSDAAAKIMG